MKGALTSRVVGIPSGLEYGDFMLISQIFCHFFSTFVKSKVSVDTRTVSSAASVDIGDEKS
jgi:hypothetical protein